MKKIFNMKGGEPSMAKMHQKFFFSLASTVDPLLQLSKAFNELAAGKRKHKLKVMLPVNKEL